MHTLSCNLNESPGRFIPFRTNRAVLSEESRNYRERTVPNVSQRIRSGRTKRGSVEDRGEFSGDSSSLNHSHLSSGFVPHLSNNTQRRRVNNSIPGQLLGE